MILEGILRKWILPGLSTQIYFIKDILLIIIYIIALRYNLIFQSTYSKIFIFFIILISLFGFMGYNYNFNGIISYFLGLRSYWIFLPLFLIITHIFNKNDLIKFIKINFYSIIPYFLIVLLQTRLPETSFLNSGYDGNLQSPERPSAFFTYTTQNTYYFLFLFFCFFSYILNKKSFSIKDMLHITLLNFLLISVMILLKSRSVYFYVFVTIFYSIFFVLFSNFDRNLKLKKIFLLLLTLVTFNISSIMFEKQYNHSQVRMNTDPTWESEFYLDHQEKEILLFSFLPDKKQQDLYNYQSETRYMTVREICANYSTVCRIINDLYILPAVQKSTLFGEGIGAGTKPVVVFNKIEKSFYLGEIDNKRIIMELGFVVGLFLILFKWSLVIILNIIALFKFRDKNKLIYIPLLLFVSTQLMLGTISYTVSFISFVFWLSFGLLFIAFNKENKNLR
tara:strand:- start:1996 stop:3345 length:1350 start_codon:yes stop_codon:yes gene_type:complete